MALNKAVQCRWHNRHVFYAMPASSQALRKMQGRKSIFMGFAGGHSIFCGSRPQVFSPVPD
ncbi:hypothetical protein RC54_05020 [Herbaspirillum rubrisubalbicans]|uniref:Uncharacterized protein n=1 Tax=Herbaspirillum rubrisubalbicans TaxID=80842 RepID=A0AAD0U4S8_9BURK|nr:hypothetical protein RC54_05020 [Herbaspirillum rubrisubalbicans]